jgi:hypothetical protein
MNREEFLEELRGTPRDWLTLNFGMPGRMGPIRRIADGLGCDAMRYCPVTAVCLARTGARFRTMDWDRAAQRLGMSYATDCEIVAAADGGGVGDTERHRLRGRLLEAVGLAEEGQ